MEKYFTIIQKGQDAICEDLHFCCDSENEDDVFGVACDEEVILIWRLTIIWPLVALKIVYLKS